MSGGRPARAIDDVPLDWCLGPGIRVDLRHKQPGEEITVADLEDALAEVGRFPVAGDIVLLWTGADRLWGTAGYRTDFPGLGGDSTAWLVDRGVRVIGIDTWGLDRPPAAMLADYERFADPEVLWPAHRYGRRAEYLQLEKLAGLGRLPGATGFHVACFPVAIGGVGAGWTRAVAIIDTVNDLRLR
jgi:kynurenine formamidase